MVNHNLVNNSAVTAKLVVKAARDLPAKLHLSGLLFEMLPCG
jgi:hypothetical protein